MGRTRSLKPCALVLAVPAHEVVGAPPSSRLLTPLGKLGLREGGRNHSGAAGGEPEHDGEGNGANHMAEGSRARRCGSSLHGAGGRRLATRAGAPRHTVGRKATWARGREIGPSFPTPCRAPPSRVGGMAPRLLPRSPASPPSRGGISTMKKALGVVLAMLLGVGVASVSAEEVAGKIKSVDTAVRVIVLEDGSTIWIAE